ncbi:MAG: LPS export ABC transporter periplasmic protein LptC [Candidatus Omnitrophica bacterium]|jgi:LPS export ABC transporter protein LptC|nr:LPS export ABC transporter periplasmic protein LptC [Candidatus Omnitrophota bacterium]
MNLKKAIVVLIAAGAVFILVKGLFFSQAKGPGKGGRSSEGAKAEHQVNSFSIDGRSSKGVKQWHIEGNTAEITGNGSEIHLNDLKVIAYGDDITVNLTSDRGVYRKDKSEVELIGNVDVKGDDGTTLRTESARWSQLTKEISTNDEVRIEREGMSAFGKGASANSDEQKASLMRDVIVAMKPHTTVTCDGPLEVSYGENRAVFHNNVVVVDKDGKMFSDKLTVNFDPDSKKLSEVVAEGRVKVKKGKSYTLSEKAIYRDSTKSAQLLGRPQIIIDPEEIGDLDEASKTAKRAI